MARSPDRAASAADSQFIEQPDCRTVRLFILDGAAHDHSRPKSFSTKAGERGAKWSEFKAIPAISDTPKTVGPNVE